MILCRSLIFLLLLACGFARAEILHGVVVGVSDGDTITVLDAGNQQHKIRLAGIDAPEKKQDFGQRSKEHLSQLVFGKQVEVEWKKLDRYKRVIGKVWVAPPSCKKPDCPKIVDACLAQISMGLAWWYEKYAKEQPEADRRQYELVESEARSKRIGLWSSKEPIPPWEFRHAKHER